MKTANPLLVSLAEARFQLSLPEKDIVALIRDGELVAVKVRGQVLVVYESLTAFTKRYKRRPASNPAATDFSSKRVPAPDNFGNKPSPKGAK